MSATYPGTRPSETLRGDLANGLFVAVAVDDLPLAALAAVDVRHANDVRLHGPALDRDAVPLIADRVGEVAARTRSDELVLVVREAREAPGQPAERRAELVPALLRDAVGAEERDRILVRPHRQPRLDVPLVERDLRLDLPRDRLGDEAVHL